MWLDSVAVHFHCFHQPTFTWTIDAEMEHQSHTASHDWWQKLWLTIVEYFQFLFFNSSYSQHFCTCSVPDLCLLYSYSVALSVVTYLFNQDTNSCFTFSMLSMKLGLGDRKGHRWSNLKLPVDMYVLYCYGWQFIWCEI